jgi:beta-lactamase superfamily II metal-dependent hydrolase
MLIETTDGAVMIDTGYDENGEDIVSWLAEKGIDSLEYLILTHPDKDHIGGADIIINNMNVSHIIDTDCVVDTKDYVQYKQAAQDKGIDIETLTTTKEIVLGDAQFTLYPPISKQFKGQNDYSIVTKLVYGETDFLFAGDAQEDRIDEIMSQIPNLASTVLKVPHHGTLMNNSEEFFEAVAPRYSIITSDKKDVYQEVVSLLQNLNSEVFSTKDGNIIVTTDGKKISISQ